MAVLNSSRYSSPPHQRPTREKKTMTARPQMQQTALHLFKSGSRDKVSTSTVSLPYIQPGGKVLPSRRASARQRSAKFSSLAAVWLPRRAVSSSMVSFKALPSGAAISAPLRCIAMSIKTLTGASSIPADVDEQSRAAKHDIGPGESALGGVGIREPERRGIEQGVVAP